MSYPSRPSRNDDYDDEGRPRWVVPGIVLLLLGLVAFIWFKADDNDTPTSADTLPSVTLESSVTSTTIATVGPAAPSEGTTPPRATPPPQATTTTEAAAVPVTTDPPSTEPAVTAATTPPPATTVADVEASFPTLPDGTPQPVLAVFSPNSVVLSGWVPSEEAKQKLVGLALANARDPANTTVNSDYLLIDANIPMNIGVRVIETTSSRFPEGSSDIVGAHGLEIDRIGVVMKAFPNVTALVIGHADQRGSDVSNYALSAARAQAVVNYLVSTGISPSRLSSRAVGESDLLTLSSDDTALTLNRRTEFTLYGLLLT